MAVASQAVQTGWAFHRARMVVIADWLAVAVIVAMPWSISVFQILIVLWLIALLPTLDLPALRRELQTPAGALPTCTLYNPAAANAQVRNITDGADLSASAVANVGQMGFEITATGTAGTAVGETLGVHWTCDSRM